MKGSNHNTEIKLRKGEALKEGEKRLRGCFLVGGRGGGPENFP